MRRPRASRAAGILLLAPQGGGGLRGGVARHYLLEQLGSRQYRLPDWITASGSPRTMFCAPGRTRTYDRQIRRLLLYPLSYGGRELLSMTVRPPRASL